FRTAWVISFTSVVPRCSFLSVSQWTLWPKSRPNSSCATTKVFSAAVVDCAAGEPDRYGKNYRADGSAWCRKGHAGALASGAFTSASDLHGRYFPFAKDCAYSLGA